ncbi:MAG: tetratricopeptide repeat protein [Saprospiraceae bacterium]|nr:tetratricopeptide repeat protein [Saprospiraceae bacterium]MBP7679550.1 tetratricopeptide repeat protein [Saprospiraceae bacterium]
MAKNKQSPRTKSSNSAADVTPLSTQQPAAISSNGWQQNTALHCWFIAILTFLLYANTLTHGYTQDDAIVIYDNMFTTQGIKGIPGILGNDTFYGFFKEAGKANLVAGGRYRPLTQIMFAVEWQLFGKQPFIGHLINIILYALTGVVLYKLLLLLLQQRNTWQQSAAYLIALIAALLFVAHPIHTEAVANIKGRDEIVCLLGSLLATWLAIRAYLEQKPTLNFIGAVVFFLALFSKENAITFLAIIPLTFWFFMNATVSNIIKQTIPYMIAAVGFLLIRGAVIGWQFGGTPMELMNNPFIKIVNNEYIPFNIGEKTATIFFTLGRYVLLLFFPHPLTHDYYPRHIDMMTWGDWRSILSLLLYIAMAIIAVRQLNKKTYISYGILFFLITLSIVSNFIFPIGTNMSERFMFMPSVGFCLILAVLGYQFFVKNGKPNVLLAVSGVVLLLFGVKTFTRNFVWKDDFTLFTTDVHTSVNSAKLQNAAGGALSTEAAKEKDTAKREAMLKEAIEHLNKAIQIHPNYKNAYLLLGNCNFYLQDFEKAIAYYNTALKLDPNFRDARSNLAFAYRNIARQIGEKNNDLDGAINYLNKSFEINPNDYEVVRLLGVANGNKGNKQEALKFFELTCKMNPNEPQNWQNLSTAYAALGQTQQAQEALAKAQALAAQQPKQ